MFNENGNIAFRNFESDKIETRDLVALLGTPAFYEIAWLNDEILYASAEAAC